MSEFMRLTESIGMFFGRDGAISATLAGSLLVMFVSVMGCSADTEDPVFGTRLPDIGTEMETPTPIPTVPTLTPTPRREYIATPVAAQPTVQAVDTPIPVPTPTPIPTEVPTPTPIRLTVGDSGMTDEELARARQQMLCLINAGRLEAELNAVVLDDNPSAQLHANDMRENCFSSLWGIDGSDPTVRNNRGGGTDGIFPYVVGSGYCPGPGDLHEYERHTIADKVVSCYGLLSHIFDVQDLSYKKVAIGLSYEHPNLWVEVVFMTDHLRYLEAPRIDGGVLTFAYQLTNGAQDGEDPPNAFVHYSPPLMRLQPGQLARTYASTIGQRIAGIRPPAGADEYWLEDEFEVEVNACPHPYELDQELEPPGSYKADSALHTEARVLCVQEPTLAMASWITSGVETLPGGGYRVTTDIQDLVSQFGAGIYTLQIWAVVEGTEVPVSEYAIFVE